MLDWHSCQVCYPLEIKLLLLVVVIECYSQFFVTDGIILPMSHFLGCTFNIHIGACSRYFIVTNR